MSDMDDSTKLFLEISKNLGEINQNLKNVCETIAKHEQRITMLETTNVKTKDSLKDELLKILAKSTVIGLIVIGTLTGASSLIAKVLGV